MRLIKKCVQFYNFYVTQKQFSYHIRLSCDERRCQSQKVRKATSIFKTLKTALSEKLVSNLKMEHLGPEADHEGGAGEQDRVVGRHEAGEEDRVHLGGGKVGAP